MILSQLLRRAQVHPVEHFGDAEVSGIQIDSRKCFPGCLFVCMPGGTTDSHRFLADAQAKGASSALTYNREGFELAHSHGMPAILVEEVSDAVWRLCDHFFAHPTRHMKVVGVTGTNGKTTTAWLVRDMLVALGLKAGYLGTLGFQTPDRCVELPNTTPFAVDLYNLLAEARDSGLEALAMEVSSHALAERRADGVEFDLAVFTNLTQDHLDFHGTMEEYEAAKWRLFTDLPGQSEKPFTAAINISDPAGREWAKRSPAGRLLRYHPVSHLTPMGASPADAELEAEAFEVRVDQIHLVTNTAEYGDVGFYARLGGGYNVENLTSAVAAVYGLGYPLSELSEWGSEVTPVPGRFEAVPNERGIGVLVDYAHTPDALEKLLSAVRPLTSGRVITVFGCGGDRDRTKRPKMARAASASSDIVVLTSDNPRTEDPMAILADARVGILGGVESYEVPDRPEAVLKAISLARPGDTVVIAGKGHENYQIIGREKLPMDDRELARRALGQ